MPSEICDKDRLDDIVYLKSALFTVALNNKNAKKKHKYRKKKENKANDLIEKVNLKEFRKDKKRITPDDLKQSVLGFQVYVDLQQAKLAPKYDYCDNIAKDACKRKTKLHYSMKKYLVSEINNRLNQVTDEERRFMVSLAMTNGWGQLDIQSIRNHVCFNIYDFFDQICHDFCQICHYLC